MSLVRLLVQRVAIGLVAVWAVLSGVFALFELSPDYYLDRIIAAELYGGGGGNNVEEFVEQIRQEYLSARGLDQSTPELYVDWMTNMFTLEWGESFRSGESVREMVFGAVSGTASYVVPAILIAAILGTLLGLFLAIYRGTKRDGATRWGVYLGFGFPNFWLGAIILILASSVAFSFRWRSTFINPSDMAPFYQTIVPALLLATTLTASIASYARAYSLEILSGPTVKLIRAKGGGPVAVAKHVIRNASIPLFSLVFTEMLALLAISVVVIEALFGIDGLGLLFYNAVWYRDLPVIMGATMVIVAFGVLANIIQDMSYSFLDPRVDTGTRF